MLSMLSTLNWAMVALYGSVATLVMLVFPIPIQAGAVIALLLLLLAAPHAYLGLSVEKGQGRTLQTVIAVIALFNFPLGTAFGIFALWVCWGAEKERFDFPDEDGLAVEEPPTGEEEDQGELEETPYELVRGLVKRGLKAPAIRQRLEDRGLDDEEIETLMNAAGLRAGRPAARAKAPARPAARPAARPPPRRTR